MVFNDLGDPSNDPCGVTLGGLCGSGNYGSWYRLAQIIDAQLAVLALAGDISTPDRVMATSLRTELLQFPAPPSLSVQFLPTDRTNALAAWSQRAADLVTTATVSPGLPPQVFEPPPEDENGTPGFFSGLGTGTILGIGLVAGGLWYARSKEWI
jgi:hypothetical protein